MIKKIKILGLLTILLVILFFGILSFGLSAKAQATAGCNPANYSDYAGCTGDLVKDLKIPACQRVMPPCFKCGDCQLNDFVWLFVNLATWGIRLLPAAAILLIVWAGFNLIMSGGNPEKIQQGKKMLVSIFIGIIIIAVWAFGLTTFIVYALTGGSLSIFNRPWYGEVSDTNNSTSPNTGCCVTTLGCVESLTETDCDKYNETSDLHAYWLRGESCSAQTNCQNLEVGCCVPTNEQDVNTQCEWPDPTEGCLGHPNTRLAQSGSCISNDVCVPGCCVPICGVATDGVRRPACEANNGSWHLGACEGKEREAGCCRFGAEGQGNCTNNYNLARCEAGQGDCSPADMTCAEAVSQEYFDCNYSINNTCQ